MKKILSIAALGCMLFACRVGAGEGYFHGCLYFPSCSESDYGSVIEECAEENENYFFSPGFFGAETLPDDSLKLQMQNDGYWTTEADGIVIVIPEYVEVSEALDEYEEGEYMEMTIPDWETIEDLPPSKRYRASYYFNNTCYGDTTSFSSGTGVLRLFALYRPDSDKTLIKGEIDLVFEDTRPVEEDEIAPNLMLRGNFEFEYARGLPAQNFP